MTGKPQGQTGPVKFEGSGAEWIVTELPGNKAKREPLVAELFVSGFESWVAGESEPSLRPFGVPVQNDENDLDFTITTGCGERLMELAEFAPLAEHGPKFESAPPSLAPRHKAELANALVVKKSEHQGGANRFLVLYVTEHGFWLDPSTIEWMRRFLVTNPPKFDRVYYVSIHSPTEASVSEIYPGLPHHAFGDMTDEQFERINVRVPHPAELVAEGGVVPLRRDRESEGARVAPTADHH